jgi:spore maturation protein SpmA
MWLALGWGLRIAFDLGLVQFFHLLLSPVLLSLFFYIPPRSAALFTTAGFEFDCPAVFPLPSHS